MIVNSSLKQPVNNPAKVCEVTGASDSVINFATEALFENFPIGDDWVAGR